MHKYPKIFIASSSSEKAKNVAKYLSQELNRVAEVDCWFDRNIFGNGNYTLAQLIQIANSSDMGIFIFNDDDQAQINGKDLAITRDNVILEYGLFAALLKPERCFILKDIGIDNLRIPTDLSGLTYMTYDYSRGLRYGLRDFIANIESAIGQWVQTPTKNKYFEGFYSIEEPQIKDGNPIDYNRSFNLLLYMFANESFEEFRAFDLAFSRWEEAFQDKDRITSQITNYSKDIISNSRSLFRTGRCSNFRRILVIPTILGITESSVQVLELIAKTEKEARLSRTNGILETRILFVNQWDHMLDFKTHHDFALFTGKNAEFAIEEISLTSPYSNAAPGTCIIVENRENLSRKKTFFDDIWQNETLSISDFINRFYKKDKSDTVIQAIDILHKTSDIGNTSVIIETAYVELIKLNDQRRNIPFERAFELLNEVNSSHKFKENIFLDAFINDFKPMFDDEVECSESCSIEDISNDEKFRQLKKDITEKLSDINGSNVDSYRIATFYMTKTRKNAVKNLKQFIQRSPHLFSFSKRENGCIDISLKSKNIDLGYQTGDDIVPNCALLMAEHYFELLQFAYKINPKNGNYFIFDFLIYTEKKYVEQGVHTAIELFEWPKNISLNIINCTYYGLDGTGDIRHLGPYKL